MNHIIKYYLAALITFPYIQIKTELSMEGDDGLKLEEKQKP